MDPKRAPSDVGRVPPPTLAAHPWHGVSPGVGAPDVVTCYVEIVPTDTVKYEVDKASGILRLDRPQRYSNQAPSLYGFIPRSYCGARVAARCAERVGRAGIVGDGDPMDVCILTERPIAHGGILVEAIPIGGFRMIDADQADDKIIAVLRGDPVYGAWRRLGDATPALVDRLRHYFLTYQAMPGAPAPPVSIPEAYDADEARETIRRAFEDYATTFGS